MILGAPFPIPLVCPRDKLPVRPENSQLRCANRHSYPIVDGIPVMLLDDVTQTHSVADASLAVGQKGWCAPAERDELDVHAIDVFVQREIAATNGRMYVSVIGRLTEYPIPTLRLPPSRGCAYFLDVGCNWGRWCIAAARLGYEPVGIDPSFEAVRAARRVAKQLGVRAHFIVGDGRFLPFPDGTFGAAFSYSVIQHLSKSDALTVVSEIGRVLKPEALCLIQLPNSRSILGAYHQLRRGWRPAIEFEVRYWTPAEMLRSFRRLVGHSELIVDGFFSLNPQPSEAHILPFPFRLSVRLSELLRRLSQAIPALVGIADSIFIRSKRMLDHNVRNRGNRHA